MTAISKTTPGSGLRAALVVAATASAGAGLVHAAAAGSHAGGGVLVWLFAACAAAQLGWAGAVVLAPTRTVLLAGVGINGAAVLAWFFTRTVGLPVVDALAEVEAVGTADLIAAALGSLAVGGTLLAITQPIARRSMPATWSAMVVFATVALVVPAMAADHTHGDHDHSAMAVHAGSSAHAHDDEESGDDHGHSDSVAADHHDDDAEHAANHDDAKHSDDANHDDANQGSNTNHDDGNHPHDTNLVSTNPSASHNDDHPHGGPGLPSTPTGNDGHEHPSPPPGTSPPPPGTPPHNHPPPPPGSNPPPPHAHPPPTGPITTLDDPRLTAAQRSAASELLFRSVSAMAAFPTVQAVEAAGYRSIGDAGTGFEHFVNWTYYNDGIELDPQRIESIVIRIEPNGAKTVASAMYILNNGKSLADVPDIAGSLTSWHNHTNLCWEPNGEGGMRLSGVTDGNGQCRTGTNIVTPPMIHVWLSPQTCGPFSGIEGTHGDSCSHGH